MGRQEMMDAEQIKEHLADSNNIRRVLILGHTGFIGGHLERFLRIQWPELEVVGWSFPAIDLTTETGMSSLSGLFDLKTAVIVCAGVKRQLGDNLDTFSQNMKIAINLCRRLQEQSVRCLVFFSSAAVYGEEIHNTAITEETPIQPTSYYGLAKYVSECLLRKAVAQPGPGSLLILRPTLVYGPGDVSGGYGPSGFVRAALAGQPITLWGDGSEQREFIFVEDLVRIVCRLALHDYDGVLNIATGHSYSFKDVLEIISRLVQGKMQVNSRPRTKNKVDHGFNNTSLTNLLPDFVFTSLEEGICRTFIAESQRGAPQAQSDAGKEKP
jgi:UDP-glucose 4-epimerase